MSVIFIITLVMIIIIIIISCIIIIEKVRKSKCNEQSFLPLGSLCPLSLLWTFTQNVFCKSGSQIVCQGAPESCRELTKTYWYLFSRETKSISSWSYYISFNGIISFQRSDFTGCSLEGKNTEEVIVKQEISMELSNQNPNSEELCTPQHPILDNSGYSKK